MAQTPRERVRTALRRREPDRVPFALGFGLTGEARAAVDAYLEPMGIDFAAVAAAAADIRSVGPRDVGPELPPRTDKWGIRRKPVSYGTGTYNEFEHYPLAGVESIHELDRHRWPSPDDLDYSHLAEDIDRVGCGGRYALRASGGNPFEAYSWMTGLEEALVNLVTQPELVARALRHITDYFCECTRRLLDAAGGMIDLVFTADDLGGQHGLLLSREAYRDVIMPEHKRLHDVIHEYGVTVLYHSDGSVVDVLGDLIEAGVDVLEAVQVDAAGMDPAVLKRRFGDRVCFHGGVSVQQVLPHSTADEVREEVARLKRTFGAGGGYICAPSHAVQVGTPPANVIAMIEEAVEKPLSELAGDVERLG